MYGSWYFKLYNKNKTKTETLMTMIRITTTMMTWFDIIIMFCLDFYETTSHQCPTWKDCDGCLVKPHITYHQGFMNPYRMARPSLNHWIIESPALILRMGFACHGLFISSFLALFRNKGKSSNGVMNLLNSILCDLAGCDQDDVPDLVAKQPSETASMSFTSAEVPLVKVQGVRAAKSCDWLERPETMTEILTAIVSTLPVVRLSRWFLRSQSEKLWLHRQAEERPMLNLVTPRYSPAVQSVHESVQTLQSGLDGDLALFNGVLHGFR